MKNHNSIMHENYEEFISLTLRTWNSKRPSRMLARNWRHHLSAVVVTLFVVERPSTRQDDEEATSQPGVTVAGGPGVPLGMGGDPEPYTERLVNLHLSRADTYVSNAVSLPCPTCSYRGPRCKLLRLQEWTQPSFFVPSFHRVYGVGGPHKTTTLITVLLAASAATAAVVYREVVDGKKAKFMRNSSMHTSVGDRGPRKECAQRILSALSTRASPNQSCQF